MSQDVEPRLSGDQPIEGRQHDLLNRELFADRISALLTSLPTATGVVVGILGPWGSGKTTVLNLLRAKLAEDTSAEVRDFNPWRLTNEDKIFPSFFSVLLDAIQRRPSTKRERVKNWAGRAIRAVPRAIRAVAPGLLRLWNPTVADVTDKLLKVFGSIAKGADSVELERQRDGIICHLKQFHRRIIVLIDDIDRLDKGETQLLFRVIKACADFPNVSYILAFDNQIVAKAIGERYGDADEESGREFLEKIIQVPIELPAPAVEDLRRLVFDQLHNVFAYTGLTLTDDEERECFTRFDPLVGTALLTPRHAKRLRNVLVFEVLPLVGEAHPVDLLMIETVRAFFPEVYSIVRDHQDDFSGVEDKRSWQSTDHPRCIDLLDSALENLEGRLAEVVKEILKDLFPRLRGGYENIDYGTEYLSRWSREQRISSPEYAPRYFAHSIPPRDVADSELSAMITLAKSGDRDGLTNRIALHFSGPRADRTIEKLRKVEATFNPVGAKTLAIVIAKNAGLLPNPQFLIPFAEAPSQAALLISNLFKGIGDRKERVSVVNAVLNVAEPLWFASECLRWCRVTDDTEKESKNALTKREMDRAVEFLVRRIKKRAAAGFPLFDSEVEQEATLLVAWSQTEGRGPVQAHLVKVFGLDPDSVSTFLRAEASVPWGVEDGRQGIAILTDNELKNIGLLIDLDVLADWVKKCCRGRLHAPRYYFDEDTPVDIRLAEQFLHLYNQRKGKDGSTRSG